MNTNTNTANQSTATIALRRVLSAIQRYLPPNGPSEKDTLSEIIAIVDPWPLTEQEGLEIHQVRDVWVAWTNTDLTEGRGRQIPLVVCDTEATAERLGARGYVMGSPSPVTKTKAVLILGHGWLVPGVIEPATESDKVENARIEAWRAAMEKAKAAGLTDDELKALGAKV